MSDEFSPSSPDWGIYPNQIPGVETDLAEIAARLGSNSTYRRTGRVVWQSDLLTLQGWTVTAGECYPVYNRSLTGLASAWVKNGRMARGFPRIYPTLGIEAYFNPENAAAIYPEVTYLFVNDANPVDTFTYFIFVYWNLQEVRLLDNLGAFQTVLTFPVNFGAKIWHNLKLTLDLQNNQYGWLYFDEQQILLSAYTPPLVGATGNYTEIGFNNTPEIARNEACYIDGVILTTNEVVS